MMAESYVQLLVVAAAGLTKIQRRGKPAIDFSMRKYGCNYYERIISAQPPHTPWPSDIFVAYTDIGDLLPPDVGIGLYKSAVVKGRLRIPRDSRQQLEEELRNEMCTLQEDGKGELERVVATVNVCLRRLDGTILVELGRFTDAGMKVTCDLPHTKRALGDLPHLALRRIIEQDLTPFDGMLRFDGVKHDRKRRNSLEFGLRTMNIRSVHDTALLGEPPPLPVACWKAHRTSFAEAATISGTSTSKASSSIARGSSITEKEKTSKEMRVRKDSTEEISLCVVSLWTQTSDSMRGSPRMR